MDNKEMIVNAAKAVGFLFDPTQTAPDGTLIGRYRDEANGPTYVWNPLNDMADTVDMCIRLQINMEPKGDRIWGHYGSTHISEATNTEGITPMVAYQLVAVRIANDIGKYFL